MTKPQHKASFAADKKNPGEWLVRVIGPAPDKFAGKTIPVSKKDGTTSATKLGRLIWTGTFPDADEPVALYAIQPELSDAF